TGNNNSPALYGWRQYGDYGVVDSADPAGPADTYPTYYVERLLQHFARGGDQLVSSASDYPLLGVCGAQRANGGLTLLVVNKSASNALNASITISGATPGSTGTLYSYGIPQDNAAEKGAGSADIATSPVTGLSTNFSYNFPAYSANVIAFGGSGGPSPTATATTTPTPTATATATATSTATATRTATPTATATSTATASATSTTTATPTRTATPTETATRTATPTATPTQVPVGTVSPTSLSFGKRTVGTRSAAKTVTLKNSGVASLSVASVSTTAGFTETNTCSSPLLPGKRCSIAVRFAPSVTGVITGTLKINDNAANTPQVVSLSGDGIL